MKALYAVILSVAALLAAPYFSSAQAFSNSPNDTFEIVGYMEDLQTLTISQLNNTSDTLYFKWQKVSESVPANWEASVCDNRVCYTTLKDSGTANPVLPGDSGYILLHLTAHVSYGTAIVRYAIWEINNPGLKDTLTFIMTVNGPAAIKEEGECAFTIFPNPTSGILHFNFSDDQEHEISIFNSTGAKIYSYASAGNFSFSTADLANGIYCISIKSNNRLFTQKIIKQ